MSAVAPPTGASAGSDRTAGEADRIPNNRTRPQRSSFWANHHPRALPPRPISLPSDASAVFIYLSLVARLRKRFVSSLPPLSPSARHPRHPYRGCLRVIPFARRLFRLVRCANHGHPPTGSRAATAPSQLFTLARPSFATAAGLVFVFFSTAASPSSKQPPLPTLRSLSVWFRDPPSPAGHNPRVVPLP